MKTYLPLQQLLLMLMCFDRCDSLTDTSLPPIFFPFGTDEGDSVVNIGGSNCVGYYHSSYAIFNNNYYYVSSTYKSAECR